MQSAVRISALFLAPMSSKRLRKNRRINMDYKMLFIRAIKSGCLCSVLYHGFMLITGMAISLRQVVTFTVVFILLYFLWLVLVSKKNR